MVGIAAPFHCTVAPWTKPEPLIVTENPGPPAIAVGGLNVEIFGVGRVIVKVAALEAALPGLTTVTLALPGLAIKLAGTAALNCVALTYVVGNAEPFHWTAAAATNPEPFTVNVNAGPPAGVEFGLKLLTTAAGEVIVTLTELEDAPPGLTTLTLA